MDLNPIRARMAKTPEQSDHTSIKQRIQHALQSIEQPDHLVPFVGNPRLDMPEGIPLNLKDYIELVDWSGRIIREGKRGSIPAHLPSILQRLNMDARHWVYLTKNFEKPFTGLVGAIHHVRKACNDMGKSWVHGRGQCEKYFSSS